MTNHQQQLANERAADVRYREALEALSARLSAVTFEGAASTFWTGVGLPHAPQVTPGALVGRVALKDSKEFLGVTDYYIGVRHIEEDGLMVFSWAAPVACTFFRDKRKHDLFDQVAIVRSLVSRGTEIIDFADDVIDAPVPSEPFVQRRLIVPKAPKRAAPAAAPSSEASASASPHQTSGPGRSIATSQPGAATSGKTAEQPAMRAETALRAAVSAPRRERLSSVLATLQADQYELVTWDPSKPLVVQGHPGTGKTIVAAHRAAYLTHPDAAENHRVRRVLVIGPTDHYVRHIRGVLTELGSGGGAARAASITEVLTRMRGLPERIDNGGIEHFRDVDWQLGRLVDDTARLLRATGGMPAGKKRSRAVAAIYEALRANLAAGRPITRDPDWAAYLRALPALNRAATMRRFLPLLAQCGWAAAPDRELLADHIIVDEAQDVAPLEWRLISLMNRADAWTLLGDMNQRRSDWTHHSWAQVCDDLGLTQDGGSIPLRVAGRGYRTTSAIMQFASRLLPRAERGVHSLQSDGVEPTVKKVRPDQLHAEAIAEARRLLTAHRGGTVAVIGYDIRSTMPVLALQGFQRSGAADAPWRRGEDSISLLHADEARGLEYDAVVVIEPDAFPRNMGRHGLLYTSLTRANRELSVVHSRPLPDGLRRR